MYIGIDLRKCCQNNSFDTMVQLRSYFCENVYLLSLLPATEAVFLLSLSIIKMNYYYKIILFANYLLGTLLHTGHIRVTMKSVKTAE